MLRRFCSHNQSAESRLKLLPAAFETLQAKLETLVDLGDVYQTAYPNILEDEPGPQGQTRYCHHALRKHVIDSEFGSDPAEVVPDAGQDGLDFRRRFFWIRRHQVGAADAVLRQPWADRAQDPAAQVGHTLPVGPSQGLEHAKRDDTQNGVARALEASREQTGHRNKL